MGLGVSEGRERLTDRVSIGVLTRVFPRDLVDEVVADSGCREQRRRLLPARVVVYYVLALGLFFGDGYEEVMRRLVGGLRFMRNWSVEWKVPSTSALTQARKRLGDRPLELLFERAAVPMAKEFTRGAWFGNRRVMAIDGVVIDVPDTPENEQEFGRSRTGRGDCAFPQVRVIGLAECGTHAMVGAVIGGWQQGEHTLAGDLVADMESNMLVLADRGFYSYPLWSDIRSTGADAVFRASAGMIFPILEQLPDGSYRSILLPRDIQRQVRMKARRHGDGPHGNHQILEQRGTPCRVIEYTIENQNDANETFRLITSIMDHNDAPAAELAALYHQRWEFEVTLDEIEIHQIGHTRVLRSKSPEMVRQEIWGILLTHYAIRHLMLEAADTIDIDPDQLSFIRTLRLVRRHTTDQAGFSPSPNHPNQKNSNS